MAIPTFSMRQLLEAGVHFGHRTGRWNPKMAPYIFGERNGVHIIDLQQTVPMLYRALQAVRDVTSNGGRVLFVGTKRQAQDKVAEAAARCGQYYVNHRWLGGMMTNWKTISVSIKRLKELEGQLAEEGSGRTKKELLQLTRERDKLERAMGGIKDMGDLPNILVVIDTNREKIAVAEAKKLGIPVVAVCDSNSDPDGITYPIPGNDDAIRAVDLYCSLVSDAVLDGIQQEMLAAGVDVGASDEAPTEALDGAGNEAGGAPDDKGARRGRGKGGERKAPTVERKRPRAAKPESADEKDTAGV
jgi:small subunit ribosomal protein S2